MNELHILRDLENSVGVYRNVSKSPLLTAFSDMISSFEEDDKTFFYDSYGEFIGELAKTGSLNFPKAVYEMVLSDDNPFSKAAAGKIYIPGLYNAAEKELKILSDISNITPDEILKLAGVTESIKGSLVKWECKNSPFGDDDKQRVQKIYEYYGGHGCGIFSRYGAFVWQDRTLVPVENPDPITFADLKGYEAQRKTVIDNTTAFLEGKACNNVLLYGDRGTGKSSTVHALLNEFTDRGLRLIELPKSAITDFHCVISRLSKIPMKFIIFIDDLSFSEDNDGFAALKAALEGGVAARPQNMLVYATSNRRHLLKETFTKRDGDDLHLNDTMQEQLSLSDRFGLTVTFTNPDRANFYEILDAIAEDRGLEIPPEILHEAAEKWALRKGGRSPRIAKQFIDTLIGMPDYEI